MNDKWYVIKVSEENKINFGQTKDYLVNFNYDALEEDVERYGDAIILITPSEELAKSTERALNEQLQEQSN